jgi:hypothetical protein
MGDPVLADLNCSGKIDVVDVQISIFAVLEESLPLAIDLNSDGCVDLCQLFSWDTY